MRLILPVLFLMAAQAVAAGPALAEPAANGWRVQRQHAIGGSGGWDYLSVDAARRHLFISRSDRVLVVDADNGALLATLPDTPGVHGIALVPERNRGYTSNGRNDTLTEFDLGTLKPLASMPAGGHNPDAILFDPASGHLWVFNGRSNNATVIDPASHQVLATVPLSGKPEFAAADGHDHVFVNIEDRASLVVIDSRHNRVLGEWKLPDCDEPSGLALDATHHRLFSTCQNGVVVVSDSERRRAVARFPIGKGPDAAAYDARRGLVLVSGGSDGSLTVAHEDDPAHYSIVATVPTMSSARTLALDDTTGLVYLVGARFGVAPPPTAEQAHPRPVVLDGSFSVLVAGQ